MSKNFKRFFYYWRLPIFFFILFFVLLWIGMSLEGTPGDICGALWLFVDIPCLIFFTVRTLFLLIRSFFTYRRTGIKDEDFTFPEIDFFRGIFDAIDNEIDSLAGLSLGMRLRCIAFRLLGILLVVGGIVGAFYYSGSNFAITIFTLVIIAGATFFMCANPQKYNDQVSGSRMVTCPDDFTNEQLYQALCSVHTPLGTPRFAQVRGFKKPVIVYGSQIDSYIYLVYHARFFDFFYVSCVSATALKSFMPSDDTSAERSTLSSSEFSAFLSEITTAVETAVNFSSPES